MSTESGCSTKGLLGDGRMWCNVDLVNDFVGYSGPNRYTASLPFSVPTLRGGIEGAHDSTLDWAVGTYTSDIYSFFAHLNAEEIIMGSTNRCVMMVFLIE